MTILGNGNVGIGNINPTEKLEVSGGAIVKNHLQVGDSALVYGEHHYTDSALGEDLV